MTIERSGRGQVIRGRVNVKCTANLGPKWMLHFEAYGSVPLGSGSEGRKSESFQGRL
jgi:hypothetical protein